MGSLRLRGKVWWIRYYSGGRQQEESARTHLKGVALNTLRDREGEVAKGVPVSARATRTTFEEAYALVVADYQNKNRRSLGAVELKTKLHLAPVFGGRRMSTITTSHVEDYIQARRTAGAANGQINRELAILRRAFRLAIRARLLLYMPYIPTLDESSAVRKGFLEPREYAALVKALPADIRAAVSFAYVTGWRIKSEVLTLVWSQVDRDKRVIRLSPEQAKNGSGRALDYSESPELAALMAGQWRRRHGAHVFHRNGKPISDFRGAWEKATTEAGIERRIPHDMRRSAVRNLVRSGVPTKIAMNVTGHKTHAVFERYNIVDAADTRAALGALARTKQGQSAGERQRRKRKR